MYTTQIASIGALIAALVAPSALGQQRPTVPGVSLPAGLATFERPARRSAGLPAAFGARNLRVVPPPDVEALLAEDEQASPGPARIGVVLGFEPVGSADGPWTQLSNGGWLWTFAFRSAGARGMRLRMPDWDPPPGAEVTLHSADDLESRGPLTDRERPRSGTLWSHTIYSDHVRLEYYLPPSVDPLSAAARLSVDGLAYVYRGMGRPGPTSGGPGAGTKCQLDLSCYPEWYESGQGVCGLDWISGGVSLFCTGGLLNRLPEDYDALLATASHCGVADGNADTLQVIWFYQSGSCDGAIPDVTTLPASLGSTVLVKDWSTDWCLIGLRQSTVPTGVTWLGWDANHLSNNSAVVGIHHPAGSWKRISFGLKNGNNGDIAPSDGGLTCVNGDNYEVDWSAGATVPGSSGSPLFNTSKRVVGVDSCGLPDCDGTSRATYGRLDDAWSVLSPYLDPVDPIYADASHGGDERGTSAMPFDSIHEAVFAVIDGSDIYAQPGNYDEELSIERALTLHALGNSVVIR